MNELSQDQEYTFPIFTSDEMIEEQKTWSEFDKCKNTDFSIFKYYLVTNDDENPIGFDTYAELREILGYTQS